jgi:hypothetical protein
MIWKHRVMGFLIFLGRSDGGKDANSIMMKEIGGSVVREVDDLR